MPQSLRNSDCVAINVNGQNTLRKIALSFSVLFAITFGVLFVAMPLRPNFYDESLVLTAAMRVARGQIPYRDFYANYGPAQFYILAGLFKIFGSSVFVERLFDLCLKAGMVAFAYVLLRAYCRAWVAAWSSVAMVMWIFALNSLSGTPIIAVVLLCLIGSALILPVVEGRVSRWRVFVAGAITGVSTLFRPDTGTALLALHALLIAFAVFERGHRARDRAVAFVSIFWIYVAGLSLLGVPAAVFYLSRAPLHAFLFDLVVYLRHHYHSGRNLPFPGLHLDGLDNLVVYLPIVVIAISLYAALGRPLREADEEFVTGTKEKSRVRVFLLIFGLLALAMYFKGFVRLSPPHLYVCIVPSTLLLAVLLERKRVFSRRLQGLLLVVVCLWALTTVAGARRAAAIIRAEKDSIPGRVLLLVQHRVPPLQAGWCAERNPLTCGMCFTPDDGRLAAIEYVRSHTEPGESLFVGVTHHDRIFANDNMIYFAAQRMPATMWSHFDPGLQNDAVLQTQMVQELRANGPPYVVLDSELDGVHEPNESSKSTGVTVLDEYLHKNYRQVETFAEMSVWRHEQSDSELSGARTGAGPVH